MRYWKLGSYTMVQWIKFYLTKIPTTSSSLLVCLCICLTPSLTIPYKIIYLFNNLSFIFLYNFVSIWPQHWPLLTLLSYSFYRGRQEGGVVWYQDTTTITSINSQHTPNPCRRPPRPHYDQWSHPGLRIRSVCNHLSLSSLTSTLFNQILHIYIKRWIERDLWLY